MDDYYDSMAEGYEELHRDEQLKKLSFIKHKLEEENLMFSSKDLLLDVGCGSGLTTRFWDFVDCDKIGIDPAGKLLKKAMSRDLHSRYVLARAEDIPFSDDYFDVVISVTAIQNFEDVEKGLLEMKRVAKRFLILTFLRKASNIGLIAALIKKHFRVLHFFKEEKDFIVFCRP